MSQPRITGVSHVDLSVTDLATSTAWYQELLGMVELFGHRNDERGYEVKYFIEPNSGVVMGFEQHDANPGSPFDERRVGLDHLSWAVESREELDAWLALLERTRDPSLGYCRAVHVGRPRVPRSRQRPARTHLLQASRIHSHRRLSPTSVLFQCSILEPPEASGWGPACETESPGVIRGSDDHEVVRAASPYRDACPCPWSWSATSAVL